MRTSAAAGFPVFALKRMPALAGKGKFAVKGIHERDAVLFEIFKKRLEVKKVCVGFMEIHNVGSEIVHVFQKTSGRKMRIAARASGEPCEQRMELSFLIDTEFIYVFFGFRLLCRHGSSVAYGGVYPVRFAGFKKRVDDLSRAAPIVYGIYEQYFHLFICFLRRITLAHSRLPLQGRHEMRAEPIQ